jgi:hypothetical protein
MGELQALHEDRTQLLGKGALADLVRRAPAQQNSAQYQRSQETGLGGFHHTCQINYWNIDSVA